MSEARAAQGWIATDLRHADQRIAADRAQVLARVAEAPATSVHICQGFRGNGLIGEARKALARRGLRQWVVMETVDDNRLWNGWLKRFEYNRLIRGWRSRIEGVLAIGHSTPDWLVVRGMPGEKVFPFAYFLSPMQVAEADRIVDFENKAAFRILFAGQFIKRKKLELLIDAVACLEDANVTLTVVGSGPREVTLREQAQAKLGQQVVWLGRIPQPEVPALIAGVDCLVLPSRHDGWGAVVVEALMVGTPVICSDRCGAAGVVDACGSGGVFPSGDLESLVMHLEKAMSSGRPTPKSRASLAGWARCLGADEGAKYLADILNGCAGRACPPKPPWMVSGPDVSHP